MDEKKKAPALSLTLSAMFLAIGLALPFLTGQIPHWKNAFANAYPRSFVRLNLRLAVWPWHWFYSAFFEICSVWDAGFVPDRNCNGL